LGFHKRQRFKGLPVLGVELGVEPDGVRKYEVQDALLFGHFQPAVDFGGLLGEVQEAGAFFHVIAVGLAVLFQFGFDCVQGSVPFLAFRPEELLGDDPIQFIQV
jgi:hypothetical protein